MSMSLEGTGVLKVRFAYSHRHQCRSVQPVVRCVCQLDFGVELGGDSRTEDEDHYW